MAVWKRIYAPKAPIEDDERLVLAPSARQCGSGETLPMPERAGHVTERKTGAARPDGGSAVRDKAVIQGGAASGPASIPLREVGATQR